MFRATFQNRPTFPWRLTFPQIACDTCGEKIESAEDAVALIFQDGRVRIIHKGTWESSPCNDRQREGWWMDFEVFLHCLLRGMEFNVEKAKAEAIRWEQMGI